MTPQEPLSNFNSHGFLQEEGSVRAATRKALEDVDTSPLSQYTESFL